MILVLSACPNLPNAIFNLLCGSVSGVGCCEIVPPLVKNT